MGRFTRSIAWALIVLGIVASPWTVCEGYLHWIERDGRAKFATFMPLFQRGDWEGLRASFPKGVDDREKLWLFEANGGPLERWRLDSWNVDNDISEPDQHATLTVWRRGKPIRAHFRVEGGERDPMGYVRYWEDEAS